MRLSTVKHEEYLEFIKWKYDKFITPMSGCIVMSCVCSIVYLLSDFAICNYNASGEFAKNLLMQFLIRSIPGLFAIFCFLIRKKVTSGISFFLSSIALLLLTFTTGLAEYYRASTIYFSTCLCICVAANAISGVFLPYNCSLFVAIMNILQVYFVNKIVPLERLDIVYIMVIPMSCGLLVVSKVLDLTLSTMWKLDIKVQELAFKDQLTGAYNRNILEKMLDDRNHITISGCISIFDIDNFKKINDTQGHLEGDRKLKLLVETILNRIDDTDLVMRYGGEEFIIFYKNRTLKESFEIAEKIREDINQYGFSFSGGISNISQNKTFSDNVNIIDNSLYYAKEHGKNQIIVAAS